MNRELRSLHLAAVLVCVTVHDAKAQMDTIESVSTRGIDRETALRTREGQPYDPHAISEDVRTLYRTGRFSDIRVEVQQGSRGKRIAFHVVGSRRLMLRAVRTTPEDFRLKTVVPAGTPLDPSRAQAIANDLRAQLSQQGYPDAAVRPEIVAVGTGQADLLLRVRVGERIQVAKVAFTGESPLDAHELSTAVQSLRVRRILPGVPFLWKGWKQEPDYNLAALSSDLARVRSLYLSRSYFDASVRVDHTDVVARKAAITFLTTPGTAYDVRRWQVSGAGLDSRAGVVKGSFRADQLCQCLLEMRRNAEKEGVLDFSVRLMILRAEGSANQVDLAATVTRGKPYRVRRIDFVGNKRFSDSTIRRNLLIDEGDVLIPRCSERVWTA